MLLAASAALILRLIQQVEEAARAEPPLFQIETLLQTAELLPPNTYSGPRRELLIELGQLLPTIRHAPSRYILTSRLAAAWAPQDRTEALRLCPEIPATAAAPCWDRLVQVLPDKRAVAVLALRAAALDLIKADPAEGAEPLFLLMRAYPPTDLTLAPHNAALAGEAIALLGPPVAEPPLALPPKPAPPPPPLPRKWILPTPKLQPSPKSPASSAKSSPPPPTSQISRSACSTKPPSPSGSLKTTKRPPPPTPPASSTPPSPQPADVKTCSATL